MSDHSVTQYDLFISYAHVDNAPLVRGTPGWVSALKQRLEHTLSQKLGRPDSCRIWFDDTHLQGNHELRGTVPDAVSQSALFLAVLSPGYIASDWCNDELRTFSTRHADDLRERIFPLYRAPLRTDQPVPDVVAGLRSYLFWTVDDRKRPRTYAVPEAGPEDKDYWSQIDDVANDIAAALARRATLPPPPSPDLVPARPATNPGGRHIVLAEVPDDVRARRDEVRRYLEQASIRVVPDGPYPSNFGAFNDALAADLTGADLFVQVLGADAGDGRPALQFEAARQAGITILQWRSPALQIDTVNSPIWRAMLELDTVQATPIEEFKEALVTAVRRLHSPPPPPPPAPLLLINANPIDLDKARDLQDALGDAVESVVWAPTPSASAQSIEEGLLERTVGCDAVIVFYGQADPDWVDRQVMQVRKYTPQRKTPARLSWVVYAPPEPKARLGVRLRGWEMRSTAEAVTLLPQVLV